MKDAFESWVGQEVLVQLGFGRIKVSLRGVLLRDLTETLLLRPEAGPSLEIQKTKVLAIEEVERGLDGLPCYLLPGKLTENPVTSNAELEKEAE